jgi:hypothetical protein
MKKPRTTVVYTPPRPQVGDNTCSYCGVHLAPTVWGFLCPRCAQGYALRHVPHTPQEAAR